MTRNLASTHGSTNPAAIEANIRHAHVLRARFLAGLVARAALLLAGWIRKNAPQRQLGHLSDHVLKDIGLRRDQLLGLVSAALERDTLALSPTGNASAPAFWIGGARPAGGTNDNNKNPKAA